ncbi:phage Gp19/Gp15/Gp42 family protein [Mycolicibacterium komossense]|uniref:Head-to-tail adaptor n=1 Tax=Mycolicibacterium komossense TaxID=1779 RepID=A0ABT3C4P2_9MYCO|nr:phage Gp19/Gp15/Gp42 family protein [Mycolicibacterium komossense]MCV7224454.1 hypothetical protein [Mycolicibacterium komossense]
MAYATAADVQAIAGRELSTEEIALATRRLAQVERMIVRRVPDLAGQTEAGEIDRQDVIDIEAEAVLRVLRNPEGIRSETDGTYGYQLSSEAADNRLRILPEEWLTLGIKPSKMFQISPGRGGVAL